MEENIFALSPTIKNEGDDFKMFELKTPSLTSDKLFDLKSSTSSVSVNENIFSGLSPLINNMEANTKDMFNITPLLVGTPINEFKTETTQPQQLDFSRPVPKMKLPMEVFKKEREMNEGGDWKEDFKNQTILKTKEDDIEIKLKSRSEEIEDKIPEKLFSSIKYELRTKVKGTFIKDCNFLICKIQCVDSENQEQILKNQKSILTGNVEGAINKDINGNYETVFKIKFTDVSYHHHKKSFKLKVSFFKYDQLITPILIKSSSSFMVKINFLQKGFCKKA
jgi:hypothetical protein